MKKQVLKFLQDNAIMIQDEKSNVKIGKRLGVSDVAVKKWFKKYENLLTTL